jgi:hypothetical protein
VTFGFTASDVGTDIATTCKVDQGEFGACSGADSHAIDNLNPGIHRFTLRVEDEAGHVTQVERLFVTDDPPPGPAPTTQAQPSSGGDGGGNPGTTASPGTGTNPGGGGANEQPEVKAPLAAAGRVAPKFSVRGGRTRIRKLVLGGLARGAVVEVKCRGRGCFRGTSKFKARRSKLNLTSLFKKRKLVARAVVEIRIAQRGRATKVFRYTMQKGKKKPRRQTLTVP